MDDTGQGVSPWLLLAGVLGLAGVALVVVGSQQTTGPVSCTPSSCPSPNTCDAHGQCQVPGSTSPCAGCLPPHVCQSGQCYLPITGGCAAANCPAPNFCSGGACVAPNPPNPLPCQGPCDPVFEYCDPNQGVCAPYRCDDQHPCNQGAICQGGRCAPFVQTSPCQCNSDCPNGYPCVNGSCSPVQNPYANCLCNSDCPSGQTCQGGTCQGIGTTTCDPATYNGGCTSNCQPTGGGYFVPVQVQCTSDSCCGLNEFCGPTDFVCHAGTSGCTCDVDCGSSEFICLGGQCQPGVASNHCTCQGDCPSGTICANNRCVTNPAPGLCLVQNIPCAIQEDCPPPCICNPLTFLCGCQSTGLACNDSTECPAPCICSPANFTCV